jgi:hypothetical protein
MNRLWKNFIKQSFYGWSRGDEKPGYYTFSLVSTPEMQLCLTRNDYAFLRGESGVPKGTMTSRKDKWRGRILAK